MSKEIQKLKKIVCNQNCQTCNILNIAQRRIGNSRVTRDMNYLVIAKRLAEERCPEEKEMQLRYINPAKDRLETKNRLW